MIASLPVACQLKKMNRRDFVRLVLKRRVFLTTLVAAVLVTGDFLGKRINMVAKEKTHATHNLSCYALRLSLESLVDIKVFQ